MVRCKDTARKLQAADKELRELEWKAQEAGRRVEDKKQSLEQELEGSDDELRALLRDFDNDMHTRTAELKAMQREVDQLNEHINALRGKSDGLHGRKGEAQSLRSQLDSQRSELQKQLVSIAPKYNLVPPAASVSAYREFMSSLHSRVEQHIREAKQKVQEVRELSTQREQEYMSANLSLQRCQMELDGRDQELAKISRERESLRMELNQSGGGRRMKSVRDQAQQEFEESLSAHDEFMRTHPDRAAVLKQQLKDLSDRIRSLTDTMDADDRLLIELSANRAQEERLHAQEKQAVIDEVACGEEARNIVARYISVLGGSRPPESPEDMQDLLRQLEVKQKDFKSELELLRQQLKDHRNNRSRLEADLTQDESRKMELMNKITGLDASKSTLINCIQELNKARSEQKNPLPPLTIQDDYQLLLDACQDNNRYRAESRMAFESSKIWYERLESKSKKIPLKVGSAADLNAVCPCCDRGMNKNEVEVFQTKIKKLFKLDPEKLNVVTVAAEEALILLRRMTEAISVLRPLVEYENELQLIVDRIPGHKRELDRYKLLEKDAETAAYACEDRVRSCNTCTAELSSAYARWEDVCLRRKEYADRRVKQSQSMVVADTGGRSYAEVEQQQRSRKEEKDDILKKKDLLQAEESRLMKQMFLVKQTLSDREKALADAKAKEARQLQLESRLSELDVTEREVQEEKLRTNQKLSAEERVKRMCQSALDGAAAELMATEEACRAQILQLTTERDALNRRVETMADLENRCARVDLDAIMNELERMQSEISEKEEIIKSKVPKIQSMNAKISSQEHTKRIVMDNLSLREALIEQKQLERELIGLTEKLGASTKQVQECQRELQRAEVDVQRFMKEQAQLSGRLQELADQAKDLDMKLNSAVYKDIDRRHRKKNIEYETTLMAVTDLDSYYTALDRALLNFHMLKIREVNKIVKELWQLIYRGEDIDMIEIVSGEEGEPAAVLQTKRSYNYRVVMRKGDSPLG